MKKIVLLLVPFVFSSCFVFKKNGIQVAIQNNTDAPITQVHFSTTENLETIVIERIETQETVIEFLSMKKNETDGAYTLEFVDGNAEKQTKTVGYYTNGTPIENWIDIVITKDSTFIRFDKE